MTPLDAYNKYNAYKLHFDPRSEYDYAKYKGKKVGHTMPKSQVGVFYTMSKMKDLDDVLISSFIKNDKAWADYILEYGDDNRVEFQAWVESAAYNLKKDLKVINHPLTDLLNKDNPKILEYYQNSRIDVKTFACMDAILKFTDVINKHNSSYSWNSFYKRVHPITPFMERKIYRNKIRELLLEKFS